jgi:hypothetical protein
VLNSERAIEMSVFVVLAVRMRRAIAADRQILAKLTEMERRLENHDADIQDLMDANSRTDGPSSARPPPHRLRSPFGVRQEPECGTQSSNDVATQASMKLCYQVTLAGTASSPACTLRSQPHQQQGLGLRHTPEAN